MMTVSKVTENPSARSGRFVYRNAKSGQLYTRNAVAAARVAVAANKKSGSGPLPKDVLDIAESVRIDPEG